MGLFKEINCKKCGAKTSMLARTKLKDGNYVCAHCLSALPSCLKGDLDRCDYADFQGELFYVDYAKTYYAPKFHATETYLGLEVDVENGILRYSTKLFDKNPLYIEVENLDAFDLQYEAEILKEGVLSDKVQGNVRLIMDWSYPCQYHVNKIFETGVKSKATVKTGILKDKVSYDDPKNVAKFKLAFFEAHERALLKDYGMRYDDYIRQNAAGANRVTE